MQHQTEARNRKAGIAGMAAQLLPAIARKKAACSFPIQAGGSYFYDVPSGWQTDALLCDRDVRAVRNMLALEDAFLDPETHMIFIPGDASITKTVALRVCRRHGQGKTIFYEVPVHE